MGIQKRSKITPDFNMSSMTDLVFLLLIFFMLTSSAVNPNALNLVLPSSDSQVQATETLSLSIDADLNYYLETQKMPFENLQSALAARIQNKENQTVILNAEKSVPIENVVKVMSIASELKGEHNKQHIAIIGDGAMTAGLPFEALQHAGTSGANILIILNDNNMSIDPNVGSLKEYLTDITTSRTYNKMKDEVWKILGVISKFGPNAQAVASKVENTLKSALLKQSNMFESLKFRYFGPIDGHDVNHLVKVMNDLKKIPGPKILHVLTVKGKGYELAEKDQTKWHAPGLFDKITGEIVKPKVVVPQPPKYQDVFGHTMVELAEMNNKIVGITPAMPSGCSLNIMMKAMPDRAFDVGIAEQHAVTFSAGLATQGMIPFCNIYSSFMQRAYDQVVHDGALQNLHLVFCLDRGGIAGADGPAHHGSFDLAFFRCIPNMIVSAPMNEQELRNLM